MTVMHIAVAAVAASMLTACAASGWDGRGSEAALQASLLEAYPGSSVRISCADRVEVSDRCGAEIQGVEVTLVLVEQSDGSVGYEVLEDVLATAEVEVVLAQQLDADLGDAPVLDCGEAPLLLAQEGSELRCVATAGQRRHEVVAVLEDASGSLRILAIHPDVG